VPGAFALPGAGRNALERSEVFRTRRLFLFPRCRVDDERHRVAPGVRWQRRRQQEFPTAWLLFPLLPPAFATKQSQSDWRPIAFADRPFLSLTARVPLQPLRPCFLLRRPCFLLPRSCLLLPLQSFPLSSDLAAELHFDPQPHGVTPRHSPHLRGALSPCGC